MAPRRGGAAAASSRARPWELYPATAAGYAPGTEGQDQGGWEDEVEPGEVSPKEAGENLASLLVSLRLAGHLSAHQICVLAHWATLAGAVGSSRDFAAKPGLQSGAYQRKLDVYLEIEKDEPF